MKTREHVRQFLTNRDETGRFIVKSLRTGRVYFVEPIHNGARVKWGDIDPAAKKVTGDYGTKYTGGISEKDSMITSENGFTEITTVQGSPFFEIEQEKTLFSKTKRQRGDEDSLYWSASN